MIKIKVENYNQRFISKCLEKKLNLTNIQYYDKYLTCYINDKDFKSIKKENYYSKITILKKTGIKGLIIHIKKYYFDYSCLLLFIISVFLLSNVVFSIEIKHENKKIKENIKEILINNKINRFTIKKSIKTLNKISDNIIKQNKDKIEWLSILPIGTKYVVSVEERINKETKENDDTCHIISTHNALITKIITSHGVAMFDKGSNIKINDILISGEIKLNDEIKNNICADGIVYGEVWYKINVSKPLEYQEKKYTKNKRYNLILNGNYLLKKKYEKYNEKKIFGINSFKIIQEHEYKIHNKKYTYEEAKKIAINNAKKQLLKKTGNNSRIIQEKVLKEYQNNSKIELEIFFSVEQIISKQITYEVSDTNDTE